MIKVIDYSKPMTGDFVQYCGGDFIKVKWANGLTTVVFLTADVELIYN